MYTTLAPTLTQRIFPKTHHIVRETLLILSGSLLVAALSQIRLPLPFTPVPLTGQTLAVLLVGAALGARRGAGSMLLYIGLGLVGLPVFAGGAQGLAYLSGATGGYLVGFVAAAYVVGLLAERGLERNFRTALLPFTIGQAIIYTLGVGWLAVYTDTFQQALTLGLVPFLIGDLIKLALAALLLPSAWKLAK